MGLRVALLGVGMGRVWSYSGVVVRVGRYSGIVIRAGRGLGVVTCVVGHGKEEPVL